MWPLAEHRVAPKASGSVRLSGGTYQDASLGSHIASIGGVAVVQGDTIRLEQFTGTGGSGNNFAERHREYRRDAGDRICRYVPVTPRSCPPIWRRR